MPSCADGPAHPSAWPVPVPTAVEQEALRLTTFRGRALVAALQPLVDNFAPILSQLHRALKGGDLLRMTYYFPLQNQCPKLVPVIQQFND